MRSERCDSSIGFRHRHECQVRKEHGCSDSAHGNRRRKHHNERRYQCHERKCVESPVYKASLCCGSYQFAFLQKYQSMGQSLWYRSRILHREAEVITEHRPITGADAGVLVQSLQPLRGDRSQRDGEEFKYK